jgi:hypothetical protein
MIYLTSINVDDSKMNYLFYTAFQQIFDIAKKYG